ncbi:MAG TPA: hypothetical protein P5232_02200 [Candidatus Moranbacteria bacterium]|nr:hypothetical protein [Candidatus Moranbacteria bacterium]
MSIFDKVEEIRKQPEHIRLRWAWGLTAIGMAVIIIIWMISLSAQISSMNEKEVSEKKNKVMVEEFSQQKKSIEDATKQMKKVLGNQTQNNQ